MLWKLVFLWLLLVPVAGACEIDVSGPAVPDGLRGHDLATDVRIVSPQGAPLDALVVVRDLDGRLGTFQGPDVHLDLAAGTYLVGASSEGWTTEWALVEVPNDPVDLVLYPVHLVEHFEVVVDGAHAGVQEVRWYPAPLAIDAGHMARLQGLELAIAWTNGADGGADFGIGAGAQELEWYWNSQYQATPGDHTEDLTFDDVEVEELGWRDATEFFVGPAVSTGHVSPLGMTVEGTAALHFAGLAPGPLCDGLERIDVESPSLPPAGEVDSSPDAQSSPGPWHEGGGTRGIMMVFLILAVGGVLWLVLRPATP